MEWLEDQMRCRMNEMKKKMKLKKEIEEKKNLIIVKLQKEKDMLMKMLIEKVSATHTH